MNANVENITNIEQLWWTTFVSIPVLAFILVLNLEVEDEFYQFVVILILTAVFGLTMISYIKIKNRHT